MRLPEEFFARLDRSDPEACWEYQGARLHGKYGWVAWHGKTQAASRVAWQIEHGPIPGGLWVLHRCDNPPCCNPAHLDLGDRQANVDDMVAKGRHGTMRGEAQPRAKLNDEMVREIRTAHADGESIRSLARRFPVSRPVIKGVIARAGWKHVA